MLQGETPTGGGNEGTPAPVTTAVASAETPAEQTAIQAATPGAPSDTEKRTPDVSNEQPAAQATEHQVAEPGGAPLPSSTPEAPENVAPAEASNPMAPKLPDSAPQAAPSTTADSAAPPATDSVAPPAVDSAAPETAPAATDSAAPAASGSASSEPGGTDSGVTSGPSSATAPATDSGDDDKKKKKKKKKGKKKGKKSSKSVCDSLHFRTTTFKSNEKKHLKRIFSLRDGKRERTFVYFLMLSLRAESINIDLSCKDLFQICSPFVRLFLRNKFELDLITDE
ncbi:hypothetical protein AB6A40_001247 [Gnathostoma spinigerum]|uniref:Uncharacterized protein n=1 Tax=Gnathostoma spinigerum TaxID=75299 RepID=A0ABD6E3W4_9BILA